MERARIRAGWTKAPRHGFRLLDAMILVAATAMGCGVIRTLAGDAASPATAWYGAFTAITRIGDVSAAVGTSLLVSSWFTMPLVAHWLLAAIPIRLIGPRPRWRRLACRPGLVAAAAAAVAILFNALPFVVTLAAGTRWVDLWEVLNESGTVCLMIMGGGLAVLVSWITLCAGGWWRAEPSWIDRLGRALGAYSVAAAVAVWVGMILMESAGSLTCSFNVRNTNPSTAARVGQQAMHAAFRTTPFAAGAALALIAVVGLKRHPPDRRRLPHPGRVAACAAGTAVAFVTLPCVVMGLVLAADWKEIAEWLCCDEEILVPATTLGGLAVLASWLSLLAQRRWRVEPTWCDRLGRALGVFWIVAGLAVATGRILDRTDLERQLRLLYSPPAVQGRGVP